MTLSQDEFSQYVERDYQTLVRAARSYLRRFSIPEYHAEDCVQDVLIRAYKTPGWDNRASFRTYLIRGIHNAVKNLHRDKKHEKDHLHLGALAEQERDLTMHTTEVTSPVPSPQLRETLNTLPEKFRRVLDLHYMEGLTTYQVGERLGISQGAVMYRLTKGRGILQLRQRRVHDEWNLGEPDIYLTHGIRFRRPVSMPRDFDPLPHSVVTITDAQGVVIGYVDPVTGVRQDIIQPLQEERGLA